MLKLGVEAHSKEFSTMDDKSIYFVLKNIFANF